LIPNHSKTVFGWEEIIIQNEKKKKMLKKKSNQIKIKNEPHNNISVGQWSRPIYTSYDTDRIKLMQKKREKLNKSKKLSPREMKKLLWIRKSINESRKCFFFWGWGRWGVKFQVTEGIDSYQRIVNFFVNFCWLKVFSKISKSGRQQKSWNLERRSWNEII